MSCDLSIFALCKIKTISGIRNLGCSLYSILASFFNSRVSLHFVYYRHNFLSDFVLHTYLVQYLNLRELNLADHVIIRSVPVLTLNPQFSSFSHFVIDTINW